ncbi:MAG: acetate--CoA ligase [Candidatus Aenigmarchaeota archaeon]|nr:acetate--CoA ligase [Candidatus Aenigmarchaeota archaeon]MDW8149720.1 acetate--CoA ligase [Candidatus Aenigmarchaeota archaeon]
MVKWVVKKGKFYFPSKEMKKIAFVKNEKIYKEAGENPIKFWEKLAREGISWFKTWKKTYVEKPPYFKWFVGGKLNASYNCLDRHINTWRKNKIAIIWEPDIPNEKNRILSYYDLYREVNRFANALRELGVKKGDRVTIYLPMIPEIQISMLACARIGAIHSVVFSAFSPNALKTRILDAESKVLITADGYYRRGKLINLKQSADEAIEGTSIEKVVVVKRASNEINMKEGRDFWYDEIIKKSKNYCKPEIIDSEDVLFILYSSGTTGKPKAIVHTTGGYLVQAYWTAKWNFDLHDEDIFWCTSDLGWITGHTYVCYGPFLNGTTILMHESVPDYPQPDRWWEIIEKYGVTIFYTAPTAIRMLMKYGDEWVKKHDLSSLRILGSVGEPVDKDAWLWYFNVVGNGRCPIIDTWWQTETGGNLINALPGIGPFIPTVAGRAFPGTRASVLDEKGKPVKEGERGSLVLLPPFSPGMLRGLWKDEKRYIETYWSKYGNRIYYTGDGALIENGFIKITGREDDVLKVAGHRLANAEIEDAINRHKDVIESAVIGMPDPIKGEVPLALVILRKDVTPNEQLTNELIKLVEKEIGPIARPAKIIYVDDLPKTRSGKIMRRILKRLIKKEDLGDLSTLANPECVEKLKEILVSQNL